MKPGLVLVPFGNVASILTVCELGVVCSPAYHRLSGLPGKGLGLVSRRSVIRIAPRKSDSRYYHLGGCFRGDFLDRQFKIYGVMCMYLQGPLQRGTGYLRLWSEGSEP